MKQMTKGDQIVYIPPYLRGATIYHPEAEHGFVTHEAEVFGAFVSCRFWMKGQPGVLRTTANPEGCRPEDLRYEDPQNKVDSWIIRGWFIINEGIDIDGEKKKEKR